MKLVTLTIVIICLSVNYFGQDIHFSQSKMVPTLINPSLTGMIKGDQRAILNYRSQWQSVASPYKTFGFYGDMAINRKTTKVGYFGVGINAYKDNAGDVSLASTDVAVNVAYHIKTSATGFFSAGIKAGVFQKSVNPSAMKWDNQYGSDGYDPSLSSHESIQSRTLLKPDLSAGLSYTFRSSDSKGVRSNNGTDGFEMNIGGSLAHLSKPSITFSGNAEERLLFKYTFHTQMSIGVPNTVLAIQPAGYFTIQGRSKDFIVGSLFRYTLKETSKYTQFSNGMAFALGGFYRLQDAFVAVGEFHLGHYSIGISYDINLSKLSSATTGKGGMEISLRFLNPNPFGSRVGLAKPSF